MSCKLPWVLAAAMMGVYWLTLNHWISQTNWTEIAALNGWNWSPTLLAPVSFLLHYPLRWLPVPFIPLAANLFNAVCAVLTLALLARCVALLPHDRTNGQRQRELSESSLLTIPSAWLPPVLAVLACGLQLTFWEHAIEASGEMVDLLLFAYLVRCLLEFRILGQDSWLNRVALVCGLLVANDWAMLGFLPCFLAAVIWVKRLRFFDLAFLTRSLCLWLAGFSLFFLLPLLAACSHTAHLPFGQGVHSLLAGYKSVVFQFPTMRFTLLVLSMTSLVPVIFMAIRWSASFGDSSPAGVFIATTMLNLVQALFLVAGLWVALDAPFSPRQKGLGFAFLPLYYLGALGIGYFSGYFLLVFGTPVAKSRSEPHPLARILGPCATIAMWCLLVAVPSLLVYLNLPKVEEVSQDPIHDYVALLEKSAPAKGAVLLSDDPLRLCFFRSDAARAGTVGDNLLIDTGMLGKNPAYLEFLDRAYPQFKLGNVFSNQTAVIVRPLAQMHLLNVLSKAHEIYYLHPSFGYFFEEFFVQPRGLDLQLKPYGSNVLFTPLLSQPQIDENQSFWQKTAADQFPALLSAMRKPRQPANPNALERFLAATRLKREPNRRAQIVALWYSRSLDYWGVQLQCNGLLPQAGQCFAQARELNPENLAAEENEEVNRRLQAGKPTEILTPEAMVEKLGDRRNWDQILNADGPFDEPSFCYSIGMSFLQNRLTRESLELLERARALAPNYTNACLALAEAYLLTQHYSNSLAAADQALRASPHEPAAFFFQGVAYMQLQAYDDAIAPLTQLLTLQETNYVVRLNRAIAYLQGGHLDSARQDYQDVTKTAPARYKTPAYYGLGEIAWRQSNAPAAITSYQLYLTNLYSLTNAVLNTNEVQQVEGRLKKLNAGEL